VGLRDLTKLLSPSSVAIVGATPDARRVGGRPISFLRRFGFAGDIYPINPKYSEIDGLRCYRSVTEIPEIADMAIIAVPASAVVQTVRECQKVGIPAMTIYTSGFSEMGDSGASLEQDLKEIADEQGTLICGPNCQGVANLHDGMVANFSSTLSRDKITAGPVGFVSQSGLFTGIVAAECFRRNLGIGYLNSTGNEVVVDFADMIAHMARDTRIKVIAGYMEGVRDGGKLRNALRVAQEHKTPVIILKVGRNEKSAEAAASHTGSIAGSYQVYKAAFTQWGVIEVNDVVELFDLIELFSLSPTFSKGPRVGILTNSGGIGVFCADKIHEIGLNLATFSEETTTKILEKLPVFGSAQNPVDFTLQALSDADSIGWHLKHVVSDPNVDVVVPFFGVQMLNVDSLCKQLIQANKINDKPMVVGWMLGDPVMLTKLRAEGIPCFEDPTRVLQAVHALVVGREQQGNDMPLENLGSAQTFIGQMFEEGHVQLTENTAKQVLELLDIQVTKGAVVHDPRQAAHVADEIGYPVALKVESSKIAHKSEVGGVCLNLRTSKEVIRAFEEISSSVLKYKPEATVEGIGVYEMIENAIELIIGARNDPIFGPVVLIGTGGVMVEMIQDTVLRVAPISRSEALGMISKLKVYPLLVGARGRIKTDIDTIAKILTRLSSFMVSTTLISDLEINPLMVCKDGTTICAADALITLKNPNGSR